MPHSPGGQKKDAAACACVSRSSFYLWSDTYLSPSFAHTNTFACASSAPHTQTQAEKGLSIDPSEYIREVLHPGIMQ
eukprot:scaffold59549_cov21-Tisochrysis_lutea.AAC.5